MMMLLHPSPIGRPYINLRHLDLTCERQISFLALTSLFTSFPNLENLSLSAKTMPGYDEGIFFALLESSKDSTCHLKRLKLIFEDQPQQMTGSTVVAILRNTNIIEFGETYKFRFSNKDHEQLLSIGASRNLKIVYSFAHPLSSEHFWCRNGRHHSYFEFKI